MKLVQESILFESKTKDDIIQELGDEQNQWTHKI